MDLVLQRFLVEMLWEEPNYHERQYNTCHTRQAPSTIFKNFRVNIWKLNEAMYV